MSIKDIVKDFWYDHKPNLGIYLAAGGAIVTFTGLVALVFMLVTTKTLLAIMAALLVTKWVFFTPFK